MTADIIPLGERMFAMRVAERDRMVETIHTGQKSLLAAQVTLMQCVMAMHGVTSFYEARTSVPPPPYLDHVKAALREACATLGAKDLESDADRGGTSPDDAA